MSDGTSFYMRLFGHGFIIVTDEPELLKTCLEAGYGSAYRRRDGENGCAFFKLILHHGRNEVINNETLQGVRIALEGNTAGNPLIWDSAVGTGFAMLPPASNPAALRLVFIALAAFVHTALKEHGIFFIHAAAVEWKGSGILFAGRNGCGKSSLARAACARRANYLADDASPVFAGGANFELLPSPEVISVADMNECEIKQFESLKFTAGPDPRFMMPPPDRKPVPVRAIFFPEPGEKPDGPRSLTKKDALLKILMLCKTPLDDGAYEKWFDAAVKLSRQTAAARVIIRHGEPFPIGKVTEYFDSI
jgi:hypothetical protein